ncbi:Ubiquitin--protein ligase [Bertholletia excelsa]
MATATTSPDVDDDLYSIAAEQRRELMAGQALDADLDLAFHLQMQEAINASLSLKPSSSSSSSSAPAPPSPPRQPIQSEDVFNLSTLQTEELDKFERERNDRLITEAERKKAMEDIRRQIHDRRVALEIDRMPDDEWEDFGDEFERPYVEGEGSSSEEIFRVYFKGLVVVGDERRDSKFVAVAGIGVAICDSRDDLIFELSKPLIGSDRSRQVFEMKALIEGLNAAIALDLKRVVFFCDFYALYQFVTGKWLPKQRKIVSLINQVNLLRGKFNYSAPFLVARNDVKFAIKLAREAVDTQINRVPEPSGANNMYETCVICLEDMDTRQIFSVDGCSHRYCFSCMRQHVEVKLLHGMVPKCPYEGCNSELKIESCRTFLTPKLIEIMSQRIREASIPSTDKIYCPYPKCSALMSKIEVLDYSVKASVRDVQHGARKCMKCENIFCINCKVPWHNNLSCLEYKRRNPYPPPEDLKLKTLADRNLWRQCVKCNHMIELAAGCFHMTCRCGFEFCYTCGAEWKNKKATCSCPLWDEDNIWYDDISETDDGFDEEDDSDSDYYF